MQLTDVPFVLALAETLPDFTHITHYDHPRLQHQPSGMILYLSHTQNRKRLAVTPANLQSLTAVYAIDPPTITVAAHRSLDEIASAIRRRLLPKALVWYHQACAWRELRMAEHKRKQEIARLIAAVGDGSLLETTDRYAQIIYAQRWGSWRATVHQDGTVSLQLAHMDAETALSVLEMLKE